MLCRVMPSDDAGAHEDIADPPEPSIEFSSALTGEVLWTFERVSLPKHFRGEALRLLLRLGGPFHVLVGGRVQPSHDLVLQRSDIVDAGTNIIDVAVVLLPRKLLNARMDPHHPCGKEWGCGDRGRYKEFWKFAATGTFVQPEGAVSAEHEDLHKIYERIH